MPLLTSQLTEDGATVVVLVGVTESRQRLLERMGFPVPARIPVRAQLDTGSWATGFMPEVFRALDLTRVDQIAIRTPSTKPGQPHLSDLFNVSVTLASGDREICFPSVHAIATEDFDREEEAIQAILGRDILDQCVFCYYGPHRSFTLAF